MRVQVNLILLIVLISLTSFLAVEYFRNTQTIWYQRTTQNSPTTYFRNVDLEPVTDPVILEKLEKVPEEMLFPGVVVQLPERETA